MRAVARRSAVPATAMPQAPPIGRPRRRGANRTLTTRSRAVADRFFRSPLAGVQWSASYAGFLLYVGVMTTYQLGIGDVAMAVALLALPFERGRFRFPAMLGLMGAMLGWAAFGYLGTSYPHLVREELITFGKLWLIVLVAVNVLNSGPRIRLFLVFWLACYVLYPVRGTLVNYFIGGYSTFGRALWNFIYANPNDLAALTLLHLSIAAGLFVTEGYRWTRRATLVSLFLLPLVMLLTQSRGAFLGLAAFTLLALAGQKKKRVKSFALAAVICLVGAMFVPSSAWERLGGVGEIIGGTEAIDGMDEEGSAEQRWAIWKTAGIIIADNPVTGVGWGAYPEANAAYAVFDGPESTNVGKRDTHSTYLNVLAEIGWPGLMLFLGLIAAAILPADRVRRQIRDVLPERSRQLRFLELGMLGFLLAGVFGSYGRLSFLYLHLVLIWATADVLRTQFAQRSRFTPRPGAPA